MLPKVGSSLVSLWFSRGAQLALLSAAFILVLIVTGCGSTSQKEQGEPSEPIETAIDSESATEPETTTDPEAMTDDEVDEKLRYATHSAKMMFNEYCSRMSDVDKCNKDASKFIAAVIEDTPPKAFRKLVTDAMKCEDMDPDTNAEAKEKCMEALSVYTGKILENAKADTPLDSFADRKE